MNTSKLLRLQNSLTLLNESLNLYDKAYLAVVEDEEGTRDCVVEAMRGIRKTIRMAEEKFAEVAAQEPENRL